MAEEKRRREDNLIHFTKNQNREAASRAGKKAAALRKAKKRVEKDAREVAKVVLSCAPELTAKETKELMKSGLWNEEMGYDMRLLCTLSVLKKARDKGDYKAYESIVTMAGEFYEKPADNVVKDDGFIAALGSVAGAIFEEGGDVPEGADTHPE